MLHTIFNRIRAMFHRQAPDPIVMSLEQRAYLQSSVSFYQRLDAHDKQRFENRCMAFINATEIVGHDLEVSNLDEILIAASSVILAWGFERWHYVKVDTVYLVSGSFNDSSEFQRSDSNISGLVGTHHLRGKMILSQPALHHGFANDNDRHNVAIHEFAHLIDMADGDIDGLPRQLAKHSYALPWLDLVAKKIQDIDSGKSDIRHYGATNNAEFFSVATEYFFEQPRTLKRKHPKLYRALEDFYQQNQADRLRADRDAKKAL